MTLKVTVVEERSIGDHMFMHHGLSSQSVLDMDRFALEEQHNERHSEAWTRFHGEPAHTHHAPVDPIETGREAALAQWEARWEVLRDSLRSSAGEGRDSEELARVHYAMDVIEQTVPTGLPVGERWVPRYAGRVSIQLEPERVTRLLEVLRSAGAHPSGLGSYEAANDANAFAEDIANMAEGQGWTK